jgi:hypothetical protein
MRGIHRAYGNRLAAQEDHQPTQEVLTHVRLVGGYLTPGLRTRPVRVRHSRYR